MLLARDVVETHVPLLAIEFEADQSFVFRFDSRVEQVRVEHCVIAGQHGHALELNCKAQPRYD